MKRKTIFFTIGIVLVLLAGVFWAGRASASVGCFPDTNGHWAETFICWLKDNAIANGYGNGTFGPEDPIKRGEMAKMLFNQAEIPPSSGAIVLNIGASDWYAGGAYSNLLLFKYNYYVSFGKNGTGPASLDATPTIPISLYGRDLKLTGFQICYDVTESNGIMDISYFYVYSMDPSGVGVPTVEAYTYLDGPFTNAACLVSNLPTPVVLDLHSRIVIRIFTANSVAGEVVKIGRTSLFFEPTTTLHVP